MERRKDSKEREGYPASYQEYKGSVQEEQEDRVFLEFNKRHGLNQFDHRRIMEGIIVITCLAAVVATIVWIALF